MAHSKFRIIYCDIGGVLGTNGWDTPIRRKICEHFGVDPNEIDPRHRLMFDSFERGFMPFESYLKHVFFGVPRDFALEEVRDMAYASSQAWYDNIDFFRSVKEKNALKFALISNEGGGITEHRVDKFKLRELADFMVISHFVHFRKPDHQMWQLALDLAQASATEAIYIDDREMFVQVASDLGFTALQHTTLDRTTNQLRQLGLTVD